MATPKANAICWAIRGQPQLRLRRFNSTTASMSSLFGPFGPGGRLRLSENNMRYFRLASTWWRCSSVDGFRTMAERRGFCTGAKQEIVEDLLILQHQGSQVTRKRENHMDVTRRKKFPATFFQPTFPSTCLTFRAMPISARVVGNGAMSAVSTFIEMPAGRGGTAPGNSQEHFDVLPGDPLTASFDECASRSADQIGHLQRWPVHLLLLR